MYIGLRASHMNDTYDFYKGNMFTNYPIVNGKLSIQCYFEALYNCYYLYRKRFLNKFTDVIESNTSIYFKHIQITLLRIKLIVIVSIFYNRLYKHIAKL